MPAIIGHNPSERPAFFVQNPDGAFPIRLVIDINAYLRSGVVR